MLNCAQLATPIKMDSKSFNEWRGWKQIKKYPKYQVNL